MVNFHIVLKAIAVVGPSKCTFAVTVPDNNKSEGFTVNLPVLYNSCALKEIVIGTTNELCGNSARWFEKINQKTTVIVCGTSVATISLKKTLEGIGSPTSGIPIFEKFATESELLDHVHSNWETIEVMTERIKAVCGNMFNKACRGTVIRATIHRALAGFQKVKGEMACFFDGLETGYAPGAKSVVFDIPVELDLLRGYVDIVTAKIKGTTLVQINDDGGILNYHFEEGDKYAQATISSCSFHNCHSLITAQLTAGMHRLEIGHFFSKDNEIHSKPSVLIAGTHAHKDQKPTEKLATVAMLAALLIITAIAFSLAHKTSRNAMNSSIISVFSTCAGVQMQRRSCLMFMMGILVTVSNESQMQIKKIQ